MGWLILNAWWITLLFNIVISIGLTWLIYINRYHYKQSLIAKDDQLKSKDAQIDLLERTQIDNVMTKLEAMKKYIKELEEGYERKINEIEVDKKYKDQLITELKSMLKKLETASESTTLEASGWISAIGRGMALSESSPQNALLLKTKDQK
jgi:hypothetical protein